MSVQSLLMEIDQRDVSKPNIDMLVYHLKPIFLMVSAALTGLDDVEVTVDLQGWRFEFEADIKNVVIHMWNPSDRGDVRTWRYKAWDFINAS